MKHFPAILEDSTPSDHGVYEFTTPEGAVFTGYDEEPVESNPVAGMKMEVAYDPANPSTSHHTKNIKKRIGGWFLIFVVVDGVRFVCAYLLFAVGISTFMQAR
ncbi:hypothetical protein JOF28_000379 [Leucobacter exalbidus]|uniref:DUF3592 domain-containing protein n=1 Tax=Leucobacter exalbidus TaxID=662960 RepID=A0A940PJP4_9MICO|nr:DUF3592 domain-containing protein [Leucobacter exalbidus]MBP1325147.1 hypothetical protein [Leucobacter exalbidus]